MEKDIIYSFVDVETTGGSPEGNKIIEIGIVQVCNNEIIKSYSSLVNPEQHLPPYITEITGINDEMLIPAPAFHEIAEHIFDMLQDTCFVAHNVQFDYGFVSKELSRLGFTLRLPQLCTVRLSRHLFPTYKKHNLDSVAERHGITIANRHRALDDAMTLVHFVRDLPNHHAKEHLRQAFAEVLKTHLLPPHVPSESIERIPNSPGVYMFIGENNEYLYIGKSIHIRDRLFQHFARATRSPKERRMMQETYHVEHLETPGEFSALLLETAMIKTHLPLYNRRLKRYTKTNTSNKPRKHYVIVAKEGALGYITLGIQETIFSPDEHVTYFHSKHKAKTWLTKLITEHQLCAKHSALESGTSPCFAYGMHRCLGACVSKEPISSYNARLQRALSSSGIAHWPYPEEIIIKEKSYNSALPHRVYKVHRWIIQDTGEIIDDHIEWDSIVPNAFDKDVYYIIKQALAGKFSGVERVRNKKPSHID